MYRILYYTCIPGLWRSLHVDGAWQCRRGELVFGYFLHFSILELGRMTVPLVLVDLGHESETEVGVDRVHWDIFGPLRSFRAAKRRKLGQRTRVPILSLVNKMNLYFEYGARKSNWGLWVMLKKGCREYSLFKMGGRHSLFSVVYGDVLDGCGEAWVT